MELSWEFKKYDYGHDHIFTVRLRRVVSNDPNVSEEEFIAIINDVVVPKLAEGKTAIRIDVSVGPSSLLQTLKDLDI